MAGWLAGACHQHICLAGRPYLVAVDLTSCPPHNARIPRTPPLPCCSADISYPAMVADMLSNALGVVGFSWIGSPAATELETVRALALLRLLEAHPHTQPSPLVGGREGGASCLRCCPPQRRDFCVAC